MTKLYALPSPKNTNVERLYSDAAWLAPRGPAYDARHGFRRPAGQLGYDADIDPVEKIAAWVIANLDDAAQSRLIERLAARPAPFAQDDEAAASLDPNATRAGVNQTLERKRQLNGAQDAKRRRSTQDNARWTSALTGAFARPGSARYDQLERRKLAADAAVKELLFKRFPDISKVGVQPLETDPHARPHALGIDSRIEASLFARYPDLARIKFA